MRCARRVNAGEIPGPKILFAGNIFPKGGHPVYLPPELQLPEAATPDEATQWTRRYFGMGLDGMKLFTGVYMGPDKPVVNMDVAIAKAAVDVAHAEGKAGIRPSAKQDRHGDGDRGRRRRDWRTSIPGEQGYSAEQLARFKSQGIALISDTFAVCKTIGLDRPLRRGWSQSGVNQLKAIFGQWRRRSVRDRRRLHHDLRHVARI